MTRSIITVAVAAFAAVAAVFIAFDDASARGRGGYSRAASHRAAMPRMNRAAMPRINRAPRMNRAAMPRMNRTALSRRSAMPRRSAMSPRGLRQTSRLSRPTNSRIGQFGRRGSPSAMGRSNRGGFDRRPARADASRLNRPADLRRNPLSSRSMNERRPNRTANGRSLPRADLDRFDRNRNAHNRGNDRLAKANLPTNANQDGRRYANKNGPMNGSSMPPKDTGPKGQDQTQKQPQGQNNPNPPKGDKGQKPKDTGSSPPVVVTAPPVVVVGPPAPPVVVAPPAPPFVIGPPPVVVSRGPTVTTTPGAAAIALAILQAQNCRRAIDAAQARYDAALAALQAEQDFRTRVWNTRFRGDWGALSAAEIHRVLMAGGATDADAWRNFMNSTALIDQLRNAVDAAAAALDQAKNCP
jgi:hypothetical protein